MNLDQTDLTLAVVGMRFRTTISTRRMIYAHVTDKHEIVKCELEREPKNTHDRNAIKVIVASPPYKDFHLGYIDKDVAKVLAPVLDSDVIVVSCTLVEMNPQEATASIRVLLKAPEESLKTTGQAKRAPAKKKSSKRT